jgi:hypothetical protein
MVIQEQVTKLEAGQDRLEDTVNRLVLQIDKPVGACEFLSTHDARTFEMVGYRPYRKFG